MTIYWVGSPKFTAGHPAPLIALVHHRMVGTLRSTDAAFTSTDGREASTHFGVGSGCGRAGHPTTAHVHQYVRLGDQAFRQRQLGPLGRLGRPLPDDPAQQPHGQHRAPRQRRPHGRLGQGRRARGRELRAIPIDRHHVIGHHYIAGRLKPSCWRPWADDPVGFPQARYLAALAPASSAPEEIVNSYPMPTAPSIATVPAGTWLYATSALEPSPDNICVDPGRDMPYLGQPESTVRIVEYVDAKGVHQGRSMFAKAAEIANLRPAPDPTPFSQAQLDAAKKTAAAAVKGAASAADLAAAAYGA